MYMRMCMCMYMYMCMCMYMYRHLNIHTYGHSIPIYWDGDGKRESQVSATDALRAAMKEAAGARIFQRGNVGRFYGSIYCVKRLVQRHHLNPDISDYIFPSTAEAEEVKAPYKEPDEAWLSETWAGSWQKLKKKLAMGWWFAWTLVFFSLVRGILDGLNVGHLAALPFLTCCTCSLMLNRGGTHNVRDDFETGFGCSCWHVAHCRLCSTRGGWGGGLL